MPGNSNTPLRFGTTSTGAWDEGQNCSRFVNSTLTASVRQRIDEQMPGHQCPLPRHVIRRPFAGPGAVSCYTQPVWTQDCPSVGVQAFPYLLERSSRRLSKARVSAASRHARLTLLRFHFCFLLSQRFPDATLLCSRTDPTGWQEVLYWT